MNWLHHPGINRAYIAEKLYGKNTAVTRSKLNQKVRGEKSFTMEELTKLEAIRKEFVEQLNA